MFEDTRRTSRRTALAAALASVLVMLFPAGSCIGQQRAPHDMPGERSEPAVQSLSVDLMSWIGRHSDYDVAAYLEHPPRVSFCECGDTIVYEGRPIVIHEAVRGIYDKEVKSVTLVRPWTTDDLLDIGTLLHELVHFVQYESRSWSCWHETEWEAYKLQDLWLAQHGVDAGFNWTEIYLLSRCTRRDVHP